MTEGVILILIRAIQPVAGFCVGLLDGPGGSTEVDELRRCGLSPRRIAFESGMKYSIRRVLQRDIELDRLTQGEIFPGEVTPVFIPGATRTGAVLMCWGYPPFWEKGNLLINARSETARSSPTFRDSFRKRRCIIPSTGFYEFSGPKGKKDAYLYTISESGGAYMAGLYDTFQGKDGDPERRYVILTTEPNDAVRKVHNRMPVVLRPEECGPWLNRTIDTDALFDRQAIPMDVKRWEG